MRLVYASAGCDSFSSDAHIQCASKAGTDQGPRLDAAGEGTWNGQRLASSVRSLRGRKSRHGGEAQSGLRILHVIPWLAPRYGGPATLVPQAAVSLAERGHHVEILTTNTDRAGVLDVRTGRVVDWAGAAATFHTVSTPRGYLTSWPMLAELWRRASSFDVIHIHSLYRFHGLAAASVARSLGVPYIIQAHGSLDPWHRQQKRRAKDLYHALIEDPIMHGASGMLCTSRREERSIRDLGYTVPTWVIPIGINADELRAPGIDDFAAAIGIGDGAQVVTFLGRISAKKGVPLLVESFQAIAAAFPLAHLVIAGPDDEGIGRDLMALVASVGLADRITFPGVLGGPEKRTLLQRSSAFVLASADESFGVAVAEAMAVGCPVVVSPDVAIQDVVLASGAGLVAERESTAIAQAITTILSDLAGAAAMGAAGRRAVAGHFSWPIVAAQMEAMYDAAVTTKRGQAGRLNSVRAPTSTIGTLGGSALRCPSCGNAIEPESSDSASSCDACGWRGSTAGGIPIFVLQPSMTQHDEMDHRHAQGHKAAQATHFDHPGEEAFETARPHGTARLYRFLLTEKFRRAVRPIRPHLRGASALVVCGGSGMDAELLARAGAVVTTSDLSLGAATRARARSERYGLGIDSIVADVEHLPVADQSVDLVAVHDGLHHLERSVHRSCGDGACRAAMGCRHRAGTSVHHRDCDPPWLSARERRRLVTASPGWNPGSLGIPGGARVHGPSGGRYAMYYPHHPGPVFDLLSRPLVFPIVRAAWRIANALVGRYGNKMVVIAERDPLTTAGPGPPAGPPVVRSTA